jgi:hypothetical protein
MSGDNGTAPSFWSRNKEPVSDGGEGLPRDISRREFLRLGATASLGFAVGSGNEPRVSRATPPETSRVVVVTDERVIEGTTIRQDVARIMLDSGIEALTGAPTPGEAWLTLFPDLAADLALGIKINTINRYLSSHPGVTMAVAESLATTPLGTSTYPLNQILIWDRSDSELVAAGYTINTSSPGVRCFGTNHSGVGYDPASIDVNGVQKWVSRCYSEYSDRLVNICLLRNHTISGVTHSLKNHYGSVNDPRDIHANYCNPYIAALNSQLIAAYGPKQQLCVCDAILGIRSGGPMGMPQFAYEGLVLSVDPVALDAICRRILEENGCTTTWFSYHIDTASGPPYNLGNSDMADIERIDIVNPSTAVHSAPARPRLGPVSLERSYPEPFSAGTSIPVEVRNSCFIDVSVCDLRGRRVQRLFQGSLPIGRHVFSWEGTAAGGRRVRPGRYVVHLAVDGRTHSRAVTVAR